jgi:hypothetical protein
VRGEEVTAEGQRSREAEGKTKAGRTIVTCYAGEHQVMIT